MLLHRGRRKFSLQLFHESGDVEGLHVGELADAVGFAPGRKAARGVQVRPAGVVVVDLRGEELDEARATYGVGVNSVAGSRSVDGIMVSAVVMALPTD